MRPKQAAVSRVKKKSSTTASVLALAVLPVVLAGCWESRTIIDVRDIDDYRMTHTLVVDPEEVGYEDDPPSVKEQDARNVVHSYYEDLDYTKSTTAEISGLVGRTYFVDDEDIEQFVHLHDAPFEFESSGIDISTAGDAVVISADVYVQTQFEEAAFDLFFDYTPAFRKASITFNIPKQGWEFDHSATDDGGGQCTRGDFSITCETSRASSRWTPSVKAVKSGKITVDNPLPGLLLPDIRLFDPNLGSADVPDLRTNPDLQIEPEADAAGEPAEPETPAAADSPDPADGNVDTGAGVPDFGGVNDDRGPIDTYGEVPPETPSTFENDPDFGPAFNDALFGQGDLNLDDIFAESEPEPEANSNLLWAGLGAGLGLGAIIGLIVWLVSRRSARTDDMQEAEADVSA